MTSAAQETWDMLTCDIVLPNGNMYWYDENGNFHRENGPAVIYTDGSSVWIKHGKFHRTDGPAYLTPTGYAEYWVDGVQLSAEHFDAYRKDHV